MAIAVEQSRWPPALWLVIAGTISAAGAVLVWCLSVATQQWRATDVVVLLCLVLASAIASTFQLELPYTKKNISYDVTDVLWIGALLLVAPDLLVVAVAAGVVLGQALQGWDTVKVLFNAAQHSLGVAAAAAVLEAIDPPPVSHPLAWAAAAVAAVAYRGVNALAVGGAISLAEHTPFRWNVLAQVSVLQVVGNLALAVLGSLLWVVEPLALLLLIPPLALMYFAHQGWLTTLQERDAMRDMARTADDVARSGDPGTRLPEPPAHDDASVLAVTLNRMLDRLDWSLQRERRFIRETSHELRTPITIVRGHLEVLGPDPSAEELEETHELVIDELDRMARLVEDMSLLARMEDATSLRLSDVPVDRLVGNVAVKAQALLEHPLRMPSQVTAGVVQADEQRLTQALINLVNNAGTHTPPSTPISLCVVPRAHDWLFEVTDEGGGLPAGEEQAVFEPFHTGRSATAGTGLGLAIVQGIARAHGGSAGVRNRPGQGATFWVSVPR